MGGTSWNGLSNLSAARCASCKKNIKGIYYE
jgi:hypothetical protein